MQSQNTNTDQSVREEPKTVRLTRAFNSWLVIHVFRFYYLAVQLPHRKTADQNDAGCRRCELTINGDIIHQHISQD